MSEDVVFRPEDAIGRPTNIAWKPEEATIPRYM